MKTLFLRNEILPANDEHSSFMIELSYNGFELVLAFNKKENSLVYRQFDEDSRADTINHLLAKLYSDLRAVAPCRNPTMAHKWVYETDEFQSALRLTKLFLNAEIA